MQKKAYLEMVSLQGGGLFLPLCCILLQAVQTALSCLLEGGTVQRGTVLRGVWRSVSMDSGGQCAMTSGECWMLMSSAGS